MIPYEILTNTLALLLGFIAGIIFHAYLTFPTKCRDCEEYDE